MPPRTLNPAFRGGGGLAHKGGDQGLKNVIVRSLETGCLNLAGRKLTECPSEMQHLDSLDYDGKTWWQEVELTKIDLNYNSLASLPENFHELPMLGSVQVITAIENCLASLPAGVFHLPNLERLQVGKNRLAELPDDMGYALQLREIGLSENALTALPPNIGNLSSLTSLNVSRNKLTDLPPSLAGCSALTALDVSHNSLTAFPEGAAALLTSLTDLNLSCNHLTSLPTFNHPNLTRLDARQNRLTHFPDPTGLKSLKELYLSFNLFVALPDTLSQGAPELSVLELSNNKLRAIDPVVGLVHLTRLDVSNNDLSNLPITLCDIPTLTALLVDGNPIKAIRRDVLSRGTVGILKYLRSRKEEAAPSQADVIRENEANVQKFKGTLDLSKRPHIQAFRDWPPSVFDDDQITALKVNGHLLTSVPPTIAMLPNLTHLELSNNKIHSLPAELAGLRMLTHLTLQRNALSGPLPEVICSLARLQYLDVSMNALDHIPPSIASLQALSTLSVADNRIKTFAPELFGLTSLTVLLASGNGLTDLPESVTALTNLQTLDLSNNDLSAIPPRVGTMTQLRSLTLYGNPIKAIKRSVLDKGTESLLAYLRDRIPQADPPARGGGPIVF